MFERSRLDNGLRIVTTTMPHARSISTAFFFGVGSRHEDDRVQGICHFVEHMLFKGTRKRPSPKDVSVSIEELGGILNAETGKEITVYWNKVSQRHWRVALDLLADVCRNSLFDADEIEKERAVIIEELSMLFDSPVDWVHLLADEVMWGTHPLGRDVGGTRESVERITRDDLISFVDRYYSPDNVVIAAAGSIEHGEFLEQVDALLGDWTVRSQPAWTPANGSGGSPRLLFKHKDTEQAHLCLATPAVSYFHPDRFAFDLLNVVLGEGMSSRLFLEVRERRGLAYDVHSYVNRFRDTGAVVVYAGVDPAKTRETIEAITLELERLRDGIPGDEVTRAREFWKGRMELRLEETRSLASWLGSQELLLDRIYTVDEIVSRIDAVTHDDLVRVAAASFHRPMLNMALIGPFEEEGQFSDLLKG